jgi:hypothetical protein
MPKKTILRLLTKLTGTLDASDMVAREIAFEQSSNSLVYKRNDNTLVHIGAGGTSSYTYVGYADDTSGTGYSTSPTGKSYVAFRTSATPLTPVVGDFAGLWRKFVGDNGSVLPTKRVLLTSQESSSNVWLHRIIDATNMRVVQKILSHADGTCAVAKNGSTGRLYHAGASILQAVSNNFELTNTVLDGQTANTTPVQTIGIVYDPTSDAVYCITNTNNITKITNSNFTVTRNSINTVSQANGIVVAAGKVFVFTTTSTIHVFDTNLTFIQTVSAASSFGIFNPDKNRVISFTSTGYVEVNPTTYATNTVSITSSAQSIAYGVDKYAIGRTSDIIIVDANNNTVSTTLGTGQGVPSASYISALYFDGKFWLAGSSVLVVIDASTNAVLKVLAIRPTIQSITRFVLASQDVS